MEKKLDIVKCIGIRLGAQSGFLALVAGPLALMTAGALTLTGYIVLSAVGIGATVYR